MHAPEHYPRRQVCCFLSTLVEAEGFVKCTRDRHRSRETASAACNALKAFGASDGRIASLFASSQAMRLLHALCASSQQIARQCVEEGGIEACTGIVEAAQDKAKVVISAARLLTILVKSLPAQSLRQQAAAAAAAAAAAEEQEEQEEVGGDAKENEAGGDGMNATAPGAVRDDLATTLPRRTRSTVGKGDTSRTASEQARTNVYLTMAVSLGFRVRDKCLLVNGGERHTC
jgi:hypothetical protein